MQILMFIYYYLLYRMYIKPLIGLIKKNWMGLKTITGENEY